MAQTCEFKTEVRQLLNLMIHSLYSNREIFLRELIANAADAIDKARFESLTNSAMTQDWKIRLDINKEDKIITITDNGIGMNEAEVIENVGTIAKSGTKAFLQALEEKGTEGENLPELIGQFGVGFYSAFMVANKVELRTKKAGSDDPAVLWTSEGEGSFTLDACPEHTNQGTEIKLFLKDDAEKFLDSWVIKNIVHKYSDYIEYPIILPKVTVAEDKTETIEDETINSQKAIWLRKPSEITEDEYKSFYARIASTMGTEYLKAIHMSAEGTNEFKALLFLPKTAPFNMFMPEIEKKGLQLYVKRVFITDQCKQLIPDYLRFVAGVVDSSDLPLNVSREILQENPILGRIEKAITTKILSELKKLLENDRTAYEAFFKEFGKILKEGLHLDFANKEKLENIVMYESMNTEAGKYTTLSEYVAAMPESQQDIYYITGDKRSSVENSPALEYFRKKGYDVLFMTDPIDEWVMQGLVQFEKKNFKSITKGNFESDEDKTKLEEATTKYAKLVDFLKTTLADNIEEVRFSARLTDSPCCLISGEFSMSPHLERMFKAMNQPMPESKRTLELNPDSALITTFNSLIENNTASEDELKSYAYVLRDQALLAEGSPIKDPAAFSKAISDLMLKAMK